LRAHPAVGAFPHDDLRRGEGQHLQTVYPPASRHGGPGYFGFDPTAHLTEDSSLVSTASRERLLEEWGRHWDGTRPVLLEKSPPNLIRTRFLQALFPEAVFVVLVRHPIAVSLATLKWLGAPRFVMEREASGEGWGTRPADAADIVRLSGSEAEMLRARLFSLFEHWRRCHRLFLADSSHLRRFIVLRYEDFTAAPENSLSRLWRFLELSSPTAAGGTELTDRNVGYFDAWRRLGEQSVLPFSALRFIQDRCERELAAFGYRIDVDELIGPMPGFAAPVASPAFPLSI
jgi:hypothetical protein